MCFSNLHFAALVLRVRSHRVKDEGVSGELLMYDVLKQSCLFRGDDR